MSESFSELLEIAESMPYGVQQVSLIEQAVRDADANGSQIDQYDCRMALVDATNQGGYPDKMIIAFTWLLGTFDKTPEDYDESDLMWRYKWISSGLFRFPQVGLQKIAEMHQDMERRYREFGYSLRPVHGGRFQNALRTGDIEAAKRHHDLYAATPRDWMSDCRACEADTDVDWLIQQGQHEEALEVARPILTGRLSCAEVPQTTYAAVLEPLVKLGRLEEANQYHSAGYRKIAGDREFLHDVGLHLQYLARQQKDQKAIRLLEQHVPICLQANDPLSQFHFWRAAYGFMRTLDERRPRSKKMLLPEKLDGFRDDHRYRPAELAVVFERNARTLAEAFDARNGNRHYADLIVESVSFCCG